MAFRQYREAQQGFFIQLHAYLDAGFSKRDIAAGCGITPRQLKILLEREVNAKANPHSERRSSA